MYKTLKITGQERILFFAIPLAFIAAYVYPYLPHTEHGLCAFRIVTGLKCPGCGFCHSIAELVHGRFVSSFAYNPMGIFGAAAAVIVWFRILYLRIVFRRGGGYLVSPMTAGIVGIVFVIGLFIQWFYYIATDIILPTL